MQKAQTEPATCTVGVLLFPAFSNHCLANAIEPLRAANMLARKPLYRWHYLGVEDATLESSSGLPVQPEERLARHGGGDLLFVVSSYGFRDLGNTATLRALRSAAGRYDRIAGLDTGAWLMAKAGLLDGRRATIHWDELAAFEETFLTVDVVSDRVVVDGDRLSCGGASTAFDLVLDIIQKHHGATLRLEVASLFMPGTPGVGGGDKTLNSESYIVQAAVTEMRRNIESPLSIGALATRLGIGRRSLESVFRVRLATTPGRVYRTIRLAQARRLAEHSEVSVPEIATRCGYADATAMTRAFSAAFGCPPSAMRQRARAR